MNNEEKEYELEIDFVEWIKEIKNHIALIVAAILFFGIAAGVYVLKIKAPVYSYSKFLNCPGVSESAKLTYVNLFKNDIGIVQSRDADTNAALAMVELVKSGSESKDIKEKYTSLIRFQFEGNNPDYVKEYANQYVNQSMNILNDYIEKQHEVTFSKDYLDTVNSELKSINNYIANASANQNVDAVQGAIGRLALLKERLETKEIGNSFSRAEITDSQNNDARKVVNKSLIWKSASLGFFLSFAYVSCKYFAKINR